MKYEHKSGQVHWIDLLSPSKEEVQGIFNTHKISQEIATELLLPSKKQFFIVTAHETYISLHFPVHRQSHVDGNEQELDLIIKDNVIITSHYDAMDTLEGFKKKIEAHTIINSKKKLEISQFIAILMSELYESVIHELNALSSELAIIESKIFSGEEKKMVSELSEKSRILIHFRNAIKRHRTLLPIIERRLYNNGERDIYSAIPTSALDRAEAELDMSMSTLNELRETNNSLLSTKQNEIMKFFTILAFVFFPLSLSFDMFGMGAISTPIIGQAMDFWIIVSGTLALAFLLLIIIIRKKWL